ncbi:hypothetical protein CsSME_00030684 [Camellia sinensis var. sinensis]
MVSPFCGSAQYSLSSQFSPHLSTPSQQHNHSPQAKPSSPPATYSNWVFSHQTIQPITGMLVFGTRTYQQPSSGSPTETTHSKIHHLPS